jgi:hypothetical protein
MRSDGVLRLRSIGLAVLLVLVVSVQASAVTTDLWDVNQGATLLSSSGASLGDLRNMFGGMFSSPEPGTAFFRDDQAAGFTHFVEWQSAGTILLTGYNLVAQDDSCCSVGDRGFTQFRLYAFDEGTMSFDLVDTFTPASNPYPGNTVDVTRGFAGVVAQRFRGEFDQFAPNQFPGPRIIELDAIAQAVSVPGPAAAGLLAAAAAIGVVRRRLRPA